MLTVYADRAGRLWRIAETCTRCAAATLDTQVLAVAVPPPRPATPDPGQTPIAMRERHGNAASAAVFSDTNTSPADRGSSLDAAPTLVPQARTVPSRVSRRVGQRQWGKIGQRPVPASLQPTVLRDELIELGDAFRAYQAGPPTS